LAPNDLTGFSLKRYNLDMECSLIEMILQKTDLSVEEYKTLKEVINQKIGQMKQQVKEQGAEL